MKISIFGLILILSCLVAPMHGQRVSNNSVFIQCGVSAAENEVTDGLGFSFGVGYQGHVWKNRLRYVPSFTFAKYNNYGTNDAPEAYFNSINLKNELSVDVVKINSFSMVVGTGFTINYTSGLKGQGGVRPGYLSTAGSFNNTNFAINANLGFRLQPANKRFGYELYLLDMAMPNGNSFSEIAFAQFRLIVNLFDDSSRVPK